MKRKRYIIDDSQYPIFVTTTIIDWVPVFKQPIIAEQALKLFENLRDELKISTIAYALMPSHLHAIIKTPHKGDLSIFMQKWKSLSARHIIQFSRDHRNSWLVKFRNSTIAHNRQLRQQFQVWQPRFDDFAIRKPDQVLVKANYIHGNPVKDGLVVAPEDYPYSSIHDYIGKPNGYITIDIWQG